MSGPPLDASGVLALKLSHFLSSQRLSAREEEQQGDQRLDAAREIAREYESLVSPGDLEIVRERIVFAAEIKMVLASKSGLPRYLQAREYRKAAKDTFMFVKSVTDRARDASLVPIRARVAPIRDTSGLSGQLPGGLVPFLDVVTMEKLILIDSGIASIHKRVDAEMKPKVASLVEFLYDFNTSQAHASISHNARCAQELLRDMNFIYSEPRTGRNLYRHSIIQRAINITWFRNEDDIGVVDHEHFSPMPISVIALTLTVIECCLDEWSDGTRRDSSWEDQIFHTVYDSHFSSLLDFQVHSPERVYQLQCDLLRDAREHAGVLPDPITGLSRFPPGALGASAVL